MVLRRSSFSFATFFFPFGLLPIRLASCPPSALSEPLSPQGVRPPSRFLILVSSCVAFAPALAVKLVSAISRWTGFFLPRRLNGRERLLESAALPVFFSRRLTRDDRVRALPPQILLVGLSPGLLTCQLWKDSAAGTVSPSLSSGRPPPSSFFFFLISSLVGVSKVSSKCVPLNPSNSQTRVSSWPDCFADVNSFFNSPPKNLVERGDTTIPSPRRKFQLPAGVESFDFSLV